MSGRSRTNLIQAQGTVTTSVAGGGTTNTVAKFTGAYTIGDSTISDTGTAVTIGAGFTYTDSATVPVLKLQGSSTADIQWFNGATRVGYVSAAPTVLTFGGDTSSALALISGGSTRWRMTTAGNFLAETDGANTFGDATHRPSSVNSLGYSLGEGANANMGVVTLSGSGTAIVYTTKFTANTRVYLTHQNSSGTTGAVKVTASSNNVSFTVGSTSATDTSVIAWHLIQAT